MFGRLYPPTVTPCSHFSFPLSPLLALYFPCHGLGDHDCNARPSPLVIVLAAVPLLLFLLRPCLRCQPLCLLAGCPSFHNICEIVNCLVPQHQFLCMLLYRPLHVAPALAGGHPGLAPSSPCSVHISLHRFTSVCPRRLRIDGCHRRHHLHCHIHRRIAPPISSFSRVQVTHSADNDLRHHCCEASLLVLLFLVVACSLADISLQSSFVQSLYANPLRSVDSCAHPPHAISLVLGHPLWGQFHVWNQLLPSIFLITIIVVDLSRRFRFNDDGYQNYFG